MSGGNFGLCPSFTWNIANRPGIGNDTNIGNRPIVRAKDSREPVVLVEGLARFMTAEDGPGAAALRRPPEEDLFR